MSLLPEKGIFYTKMIAEREKPTSNEIEEQQLFNWLQKNVERVIGGDSRECTLLAYDFRGGREVFLFPPISLPNGEGPFSETERIVAFNRILDELLPVDSAEEREEWVETIIETTKEDPPDPDRIIKRYSEDVLEWQFSIGHDVREVYLVVHLFRGPEPLGIVWHLRNLNPKSRLQKAGEKIRQALGYDEQFVQI